MIQKIKHIEDYYEQMDLDHASIGEVIKVADAMCEEIKDLRCAVLDLKVELQKECACL